MKCLFSVLSAIVIMGAASSSFADVIENTNGSVSSATTESLDLERGGHFGGGHSGGGHSGGGHSGGGHSGGGHSGGGHSGGGHSGGGHSGGGHVGGGHVGGGHVGHIGTPARFYPGRTPRGGWRGNRYYYGGFYYNVWGWGPYAPFYGWGPYYGWRLGLGYYIPTGLVCRADNTMVAGSWLGPVVYYSSDDAINAALDVCKNDPYVLNAGAQAACRIVSCFAASARSGD